MRRLFVMTIWMVLTPFLTYATNHYYFRTVDVKDGLADNFVRDITCDSYGYIWISTINGLSRYDGYRLTNYMPQQYGELANDVLFVRETADSTLWMLCSKELMTYKRMEGVWQNDGRQRLAKLGMEGTLKLFHVDDKKNLWVTTEYGLFCYDYDEKELYHFNQQGIAPITHVVSRDEHVLAITVDQKIYKVHKKNKKLTLVTRSPLLTNSRDNNVYFDSQLNLWLYHAHTSVGQQWIYSLKDQQWHLAEELKMLGDVTVNTISEDQNGNIWVGTGNDGIGIFSRHSNGMISHNMRTEYAFKPHGGHIGCFFLDRNNNMWVGSGKLGIAFTDLNSPHFSQVPIAGHEDVSALAEDAKGNLWIGFDGSGIMKKSPNGGSTHYSTSQNTLPSDIITSINILTDGSVLAGTYGNGIVKFDGTKFSPFYHEHTVLKYVKDITVDSNGNIWVATVDRGVVMLTMLYFASLLPGHHVLQVKAVLGASESIVDDTANMQQNNISELDIQVLPPIWLTKWAFLIYLLVLISIVYLLYKGMKRQQKRELAIKQMEINLKKYEMEEEKISFFTNISHDIKTPLTMVIAPLEKIRETILPDSIRTEVDVAWQNAKQLYDLVLELLDFRRMDVGKEKIHLSHGELVSFVKQTVQGFAYYAARKHIKMQLQLPSVPIETLFDENKMRRIITNLLSNACKYNVEHGTITISLSTRQADDNNWEIVLCVSDTGLGINDKHHVFDRFMQEQHGQEQEGSGLGLYIVKEYVMMMEGTVSVTDNKPTGTVFKIKKNIKYSHIPIILLTAKNSEENIIEGLENGVADYITKPFSLAVLRLRIRKIIEWTWNIHEKVATGIEIKPSEITVSSLDEELIRQVIDAIEANIQSTDYSVVQLSSAVNMTLGNLYKKLMAITANRLLSSYASSVWNVAKTFWTRAERIFPRWPTWWASLLNYLPNTSRVCMAAPHQNTLRNKNH